MCKQIGIDPLKDFQYNTMKGDASLRIVACKQAHLSSHGVKDAEWLAATVWESEICSVVAYHIALVSKLCRLS